MRQPLGSRTPCGVQSQCHVTQQCDQIPSHVPFSIQPRSKHEIARSTTSFMLATPSISGCKICTHSSFLAQLLISAVTSESTPKYDRLLFSSISYICSKAPDLRKNASVRITQIPLSDGLDNAASCLLNSLRSGSFRSFVG